jgi:hypothetical protein
MEGWEHDDPFEGDFDVLIPLVQPMKNVEDEGMIRHWLIEVAKGINHAVHLPTIFVHIHVTLNVGPEHDVEVESIGLMVTEELLLDGNPSLMICVAALLNNVMELDGEHTKESVEDDNVHHSLAGKSRISGVRDDMVVEGVPLQHQHDEVTPTDVVAGEGVKDDGDDGSDVLDTNNLGIDVGDEGGLIRVIGVGEMVMSEGSMSYCSVVRRLRMMASASAFSCGHTRAVAC